MFTIILITILTILVYRVFFRPYNYWKDRNVVYEKPWPFFGNYASVIFRKQSIFELVDGIYKKHPDRRYVGFYGFFVPTLLLRDPDLIKQVGVKDFDAFPEHRMVASEENDPIWAKNLFAMQGGEKWKDVRAIVSPTFTSSKLKAMFGFITECAKQFTDHFPKKEDLIKLELRDAFNKVTNDIIASTAFGVSCNSLKDPNNEIFVMGKGASDISGVKGLKFLVASIEPRLIKFLRIRFIDKITTNFFRKVMKETIKIREEQGIVRPDMVHLMMEAKKGRSRQEDVEVPDSGYAIVQEADMGNPQRHRRTEITDDLITAQAVLFFLAGFDTTSRAMCFTSYELAVNPDIQDRLREEVDQTLENCNGQVSYESLLGMKYLDMVISEALRKWPPFAMTDRRLTKTCIIEPKLPEESLLTLIGDVVCNIPIYSIHRDPENYPNPDKFDPERFNEENKQNIKPFTYLPFGVGPRNCIASRFALLEIKTVLFYLLCKFEIVVIEKTRIPLTLSKSNINPVAEDGFWLGLKSRNNIDPQ